MIWLKRIAITLTSLVTIVLLLVWIAVGRLGSPTLLSFAASYVPALSISNISGGLSSTLILEALKYQSDGIELSIERTELTLRWRCLVQFSVCADSLNTEGLTLSLLSSTAEDKQDKPVNEVITLPLLVAVDSLSAKNSYINLADGTIIRLDTLQSELRIYQRWRMLSPQLDGLTISRPLHKSLDNQPVGPNAEPAPADIQLEEIFIPINAEVTQLQLTNAVFEQNHSRYALESLLFDGRVNGHQVDINSIKLRHKEGSLEANARAKLSDEFPLDANLNIRTALVDMPPLAAEVALQGSIQDLVLKITSDSPVLSVLNAQIKPLSAELPIELTLQWQGFNQNDLTPIAVPDMAIDKGQLTVSGDLNDYKISANTVLTVPQITTPIRLDLNSLANTKRIDINSLMVGLLNGTVESSGQVNLTDSMNWQLSTRLADIDGQLVDQRLPTSIGGKLEYQGQLTDGKPNVNVQTIDVMATQQGYPLSIVGSGAYAASAGVVVSNMRIAHKQNHIQGFARMLIDRRIDADIIVAIEALGESLPGYEGQVRGNMLAMGDSETPDVEVMLDATQITGTDPEGSQFLVADAASLRVSGTTLKQSVTLDFERAGLEAVMQSDIEFKDSLWIANITQATLRNDPIQAVLNDTTSIRFDPKTSTIKTEGLCWDINTQGEACVVQLFQGSENTEFSVSIDDIAVDDWLTLYSSALPVATDDARLSAKLKGSYSNEAGLIANAEGEISDSEWQLGNSEQNTVVSIEPARFTLTANRNLIDSELSLSSKSIGEVHIKSKFNTAPDQQRIQAKVAAKRVLLAPFAFLSNDINKLEGIFDANLTFEGSIAKPEVTGSLQLKRGAVDVIRAPAVITDWNVSIAFNQFSADYSSEFNLGGGLANLDGSIDWREEFALNAALKGTQLNVNYQDIDVNFSPDVAVIYSQEKLIANGSVTVPKAKIALQRLPQNAITPSSDVHLRGEPESVSLLDRAEVNLDISIDPEGLSLVELDAFGLNANLTGQMRLSTQPTVMGFGDLQIVNGEYRAYGQELLIRAGEIQFNGPLSQPMLFVEAIRDPQLTEDSVIAGIVIDGLASQPNIRLFSEPSMDQSQNLAYLLSGRGNIGGSEVDKNAFAGLLVGFGVSNSGGLAGRMGEALGINDLQLETKGGGGDTQVAVSGTIAPNLTLEYGVGVFESVSEVKLRYALLPKLYVEATSGLEQSLVLYYEFAVGEVKQGVTPQSE